MRGIDSHEKYKEAQKKFKKNTLKNKKCHEVGDCDSAWSIFKEAFLEVSKYKCPMCETNLEAYDDIDHIQPKAQYPLTKCCCKNYLLICAACNRAYKRDKFPIDDENKLLINPREDNIFDYFQIHFLTLENSKKVLYIAPKKGLTKKQQLMAKKTIEVYGLADCESDSMKDRCRTNLLMTHYFKFIKFARAREESKEKFMGMLDDIDYNDCLSYGFITFIYREQFEILDSKPKTL